MKFIEVTTRRVYGNRVIYPHCEVSKDFARIAGTKTLTLATLKTIKALGYELHEVFHPQLDEVLK